MKQPRKDKSDNAVSDLSKMRLFADTEFADKLFVSFRGLVGPVVIEEVAAATHQNHQAATARKVFFIAFEVLRQFIDSAGQHGHLNRCAPGIFAVQSVLLGNFFFNFLCQSHNKLRVPSLSA